MTRFDRWPRWAALGLIALALLLAGYGAAQQRTRISAETGAPEMGHRGGSDLRLYSRVAARVAAGDDYYAAAAAAQRDLNFPLKPFVTMRLPTLAWLLATLPGWLALALFYGLMAAGVAAWRHRLRHAFASPTGATIAALGLGAGFMIATPPSLLVFHEAWAAVLIALALALWRPDRWLPSAVALTAAVLIRETALPVVLVMGALAVLARRWREAVGWAAVTAISLAALALHAAAVASVVTAADPASPSWAGLGGWRFALTAVQLTGPFAAMPYWVTAIAVPLAMIGWLGWRDPAGLRVAAVLAGYLLGFTLFGRPDNFYWGLLIAPLVLPGVIMAPAAVRALLHAAGIAPAMSRQTAPSRA